MMSRACYIFFLSKTWINKTWRFWTFGYLYKSLFWSGFWLGFSNVQDLLYIRIFKVKSLSDKVHGKFLQYENFKSVLGRVGVKDQKIISYI